MSKAFVYAIRSDLPGTKLYIGKANDPERRWKDHRTDGRHHPEKSELYADMNRLGVDHFKLEVLSKHETEEEAYEAERIIIKKLLAIGVDLYQKNSGWQSATSARQIEVCNRPEVRAKLSRSMKEASARPEVRARRCEAMKEVQNRPEVKASRSASLKETMNRPDVKSRQRASLKRVMKEVQNRPEVNARKSATLTKVTAEEVVECFRLRFEEGYTQAQLGTTRWRYTSGAIRTANPHYDLVQSMRQKYGVS